MNIIIDIKDREYRITSDKRNYILEEVLKVTDKETKEYNGKIRYVHFGFYDKLSSLLESLYELGLKNNNVTNFRELIQHSEEVKNIINNYFKGKNEER